MENTRHEIDAIDPETIYLVRTELRAEEILRKSVSGAEKAVFNFCIVTFPRLFEKLYADLSGGRLIERPGQLVIIRKILEKHYRKNQTGYFRRMAGPRTGLPASLLDFFGELKQSLVSPEEFSGIVGKMRAGIKQKNQELAVLYSEFGKEMKRLGLIDEIDRQKIVMDALADSNIEFNFLKGKRRLEVIEVYNPSLVQFRTIVALAERMENARVSLPYNPDRQDAFRFFEETTLRLFEGLGETTQKFDPVEMFFLVDPARTDLLSHVLRHIFKSPDELSKTEKRLPDESIVVTENHGFYNEVDEIGRQVKNLLDSGIGLDRICVVFRSLEEYGSLVEEIFGRFGIPVYFRRRSSLTSEPLIKMLLSVPEAILKDFGREAVLKLLGSGIFRIRDFPQDIKFEDVQSLVYNAGVTDARIESWQDCFSRYLRKLENSGKSGHKSRDVRKPENVRRIIEAVEKFLNILAEFSKPKPTGAFIAGYLKLLEQMGVPGNLPEASSGTGADMHTAWNSFTEVLRGLDETAGFIGLTEPVELDGFYRILLEAMEGKNIPALSSGRSGIRVLEVHDIIGIESDYLFLGGLTDGQFPKHKYEDFLFSDDEKEGFNGLHYKLKPEHGNVFRSLMVKHQEEPMLFYLALCGVRKKLFLSYSNTDRQGKVSLASTLLRGLLRLIDAGKEEKQEEFIRRRPFLNIQSESDDVCDRSELLNRLACGLWNRPAAGREEVPGTRADIVFPELKRITNLALMEHRRENNIFSGRIEDPGLRAEIVAFLSGNAWNVTGLETYLSCPFRFFCRYVLGIEEFQEPSYGVDPRSEGNMVHSCLERFFALRAEKGEKGPADEPAAKREAILQDLEKTAAEVFREKESMENFGAPVFRQFYKHGILRRLKRLINCEMDYGEREMVPTLFEFRFSGAQGACAPAYSLKISGNRVIKLSGRIDRIDISSDGKTVRVIDYKDSARSTVGVDLQVPVYLMVIRDFLSGQGRRIETMQGGYYYLKEEKVNKILDVKLYNEAELKEKVSGISEALKGIEAGNFEPGSRKCPRECPAGIFCRIKGR